MDGENMEYPYFSRSNIQKIEAWQELYPVNGLYNKKILKNIMLRVDDIGVRMLYMDNVWRSFGV